MKTSFKEFIVIADVLIGMIIVNIEYCLSWPIKKSGIKIDSEEGMLYFWGFYILLFIILVAKYSAGIIALFTILAAILVALFAIVLFFIKKMGVFRTLLFGIARLIISILFFLPFYFSSIIFCVIKKCVKIFRIN